MGPVTRTLILLNVAAFALQQLAGAAVAAHFALWPVGHYRLPGFAGTVGFEPWQLVTSAFLHVNATHILLNMFAVFMFGREVEHTLGARSYLVLYFSAVLSAALVQLVVVSSTVSAAPYPTVGASGGVFGILLAFAVLYPRRIVVLLFPPIPMPAWLFVAGYAFIELANGVFGTQAGVAHFAHLGGMLGGYVALRYWRRPES
jgi:membrane associated rhomboid family serine protease